MQVWVSDLPLYQVRAFLLDVVWEIRSYARIPDPLAQLSLNYFRSLIGGNRQLVTDEPVEFEKWPVGLANTRFATEYAQKSPRSLLLVEGISFIKSRGDQLGMVTVGYKHEETNITGVLNIGMVVKICETCVVALLNIQTPIFEWYVTKLVLEIGHQEDSCYDGVEICVQNIRHLTRFNR